MIGHGKETKMRVAHEAAAEGTTLVGPPFLSRPMAGPLGGADNLDSFVPLLIEMFGEGWCAGGNLSVMFKGSAAEGDPLRAEATPGRERARLELRTKAMVLVCQGTGADHADAGSELSRRLLSQEAAPRSAVRILTGLTVGAEAQGIALSLPAEAAKAAPQAALAPSQAVELAGVAISHAVGAELAASGRLGGVEIQFLEGPLRAGADYLARTRLHAVTESLEAEAVWFDVLIADPKTGRDQARLTFCLTFSKAASPLWT